MAIVHPGELPRGELHRGYKRRNRLIEYLNPSGGRTHDLHRWLASRRVTRRNFGKELRSMGWISAITGVGLGVIVFFFGSAANNPMIVIVIALGGGAAGMLLIGCWRLLWYLAHVLLGRYLERTCQRGC